MGDNPGNMSDDAELAVLRKNPEMNSKGRERGKERKAAIAADPTRAAEESSNRG